MRNGNDTNQKIGFVIQIVVEPDGDQYYAYVPALQGLHADGETENAAIRNALELAEAYVESLIKHGDPIPLAAVGGPAVSHQGKHPHTERFDISLNQLQPA